MQSSAPPIGNAVVQHHNLFKKQESSKFDHLNKSTKAQSDRAAKPEDGVVSQTEDRRHAKLMKSIINPENPFSKMTDRDMLIFNPNYTAYLQKLKSKADTNSELSRIMDQPYKPGQQKKKEQLALFAFTRMNQTNKHSKVIETHQRSGGLNEKSQSHLNSRSMINADVMI